MNRIMFMIYTSFIILVMFQNCAQNGFEAVEQSSTVSNDVGASGVDGEGRTIFPSNPEGSSSGTSTITSTASGSNSSTSTATNSGTSTSTGTNSNTATNSGTSSNTGTSTGSNTGTSTNTSTGVTCTSPNYIIRATNGSESCGTCPSTKSYHSDTHQCVTHLFSATAEAFSTNPETFHMDFRLNLDSAHLNNTSVKNYWFLAGGISDGSGGMDWVLYDKGLSVQNGKPEWKRYYDTSNQTITITGNLLSQDPKDFPFSMLNFSGDVTALGGYELRAGYGRGENADIAFEEMLSSGRAAYMTTIQKQYFSAAVTGVPSSSIFNANTIYNIKFSVKPDYTDYGKDGMKYYALALLPESSTWLMYAPNRVRANSSVPGDWVEIKADSQGRWIAIDGSSEPFTESTATLAATGRGFNWEKIFPLTGSDLANFRGFTFYSGFGTSISDMMIRKSINNQNLFSPAVVVPK